MGVLEDREFRENPGIRRKIPGIRQTIPGIHGTEGGNFPTVPDHRLTVPEIRPANPGMLRKCPRMIPTAVGNRWMIPGNLPVVPWYFPARLRKRRGRLRDFGSEPQGVGGRAHPTIPPNGFWGMIFGGRSALGFGWQLHGLQRE